jgi:hypothetical protein
MGRIKVRRNFSFVKALDDVLPTERDWLGVGEKLTVQIENQTLSGVDENGQPFAPLAQPKYGSDRADLHDTGRMFADFGVVRVSRKGFALGFRSKRSADIAGFHQEGTSRMPARPFLTPNPRWIVDMLRRLIRRRR